MLAWLKEILGELYTDEIDSSVSKKIGENFVPKADFNEKNEAVKRLKNSITFHPPIDNFTPFML